MALDKNQRKIVEALLVKPQGVRQLMLTTGYSDTYLRNNLKLMVREKEITIDESRQPYLYSVSEQSPELKLRRALDEAKSVLKAETIPDNSDPIYKRIRNSKKEAWIDFAEFFEVMARAIRELDADGELIDTLEGK